MLRNFFLINIILLCVAGFIGYKLFTIITEPMDLPDKKSIETVQKVKKKEQAQGLRKKAVSYDVITKNNLFNPARTSEKAVQQVEKSPPPKNQPKLFGTIILGDKKTAIIQDPDTRSTKMYGMNESIAGYTISDIQEDKVVLLWSGEEVVIRLREDKGVAAVPKPRAEVRKPVTTPRDTSSRRTRQRRPRRTRRSVAPPPPPPGAQ